MNLVYSLPPDFFEGGGAYVNNVLVGETLPMFLERRGTQLWRVPYSSLLPQIQLSGSSRTADLFLLHGSDLAGDVGARMREQEAVARSIRSLSSTITTADHRKWNALPILGLVHALSESAQLDRSLLTFASDSSYDAVFATVERMVEAYRAQLLNELDNLGFLVVEDHGRLRVAGPALAPKTGVESALYYAPDSDNRIWTVDRDAYGVQYDIELFEALVNDAGVDEPRLQQFFEEHPYFLTQNQFEALPHPRLAQQGTGDLYIPDFVLKPIVAAQRDSNWEVLDLKLPQARLLAGQNRALRLSHEVMNAIRQLRYYRDYFLDPRNTATVNQVLGAPLRRPRLAVLIGRLPDNEELLEALEREQAEVDVRIVTYDELLERQIRLLG